jgi:ribosomal protein S18 acetylase RimI-like enzyme
VTQQGPGATHPVLRCGRCGRFADWGDSRLQIVCTCRPHLDLLPVLVRESTAADADRVAAIFRRHFGHTPVIAFGQVVALEDVATLVAEAESEIGAALAWRSLDDALHIVALATDPMWQRAGLAGHLVAETELLARRQGHGRVVATIMNDNIPALYFYQRRGYRVVAVRPDSLADGVAPEASGFAGIPIRDEIQLTRTLGA